MMRRTIVLLATMALTLLVASRVALAVTKIGGPGPDTLRGTNGDDNLLGKGGNDKLYALRGRDNLLCGSSKDLVGIQDSPAVKDLVTCGSGFDQVYVDSKDVVARDCERVHDG